MKKFLKDPLYTKRAKKDLGSLKKSLASYRKTPSGKAYVDTEVKVGRAKASAARAGRRSAVADGGTYGGVVGGGSYLIAKSMCKKKHPNDKEKYEICMYGKKKKK